MGLFQRAWLRRRDDGIEVRVPDRPKEVVRQSVDAVRDLLLTGGEGLDRLFPTTYPNHPDLDAEYQRYMRSELLASRLSALEVVAETLDARHIDDGQADQWMQAINAARVALGTIIGIDHDGWGADELGEMTDDDPRFAMQLAYEVLGVLLSDLIDVLSPDGFQQPEPGDPRISPSLDDH